MAVHCLVRVVSRSDRRLLRLLCHSPAEVKTALAKQLDLDPGQLVVVHQGNILHDSCNLEDLKRSPSAELNLISFILDTDQCRLAEFAKTFESVLTVPVSAITPQSSLERNVVYEIPVHNAMEFLGRYLPATVWFKSLL